MRWMKSSGIFRYKTDPLVPARRLDLDIIYNFCIMVFDVHVDHREIIRNLKKWQVIRLCQRTVRAAWYEGFGYTSSDWYCWNGPQMFLKRTGRMRSWRTNRDYPDFLLLARNPEESRRSWETWCHLDSGEIITVNTGLKNSQAMKKYNNLDLVREITKLWNMRVTAIPIVIGALGIVTTCMKMGLDVLEIRWWIETNQSTAMPKPTRTL